LIQPRRIGGDRLLTVSDIAALMGVCDRTAIRLMGESGHMITAHRRKYVLESGFYSYLKRIAGAGDSACGEAKSAGSRSP